jgi:tetratricopeptide (TPR) repeat protein
MTRTASVVAWVLAGSALAAPPEEYASLMDATRSLVKTNKVDEASERCLEARRAGSALGPLEEAKALELCGQIEERRDRFLGAADRYASGARLASQDLRLRQRLLSSRRRAADRAKAQKSVELATAVLEADRALKQTMLRPRREGAALEATLAALAKAERTYRSDGDRDRAQEARAVRALVLARSKRPDDAERIATKVVEADRRAPGAERIAHEALATVLLERDDLEQAVRSAIRFNQLRNQTLPEEKRYRTRAPILARICAKLEQRTRPGQCTRLEIELAGEPTFTDFSAGRRKPELTDEDIERVHAEALPAVEACVLGAAKKEPELYRGVDIELTWAIDSEGRAVEVDLTPQRNREDIMPCASARLERVRYPKAVSRERKTVVIPYRID